MVGMKTTLSMKNPTLCSKTSIIHMGNNFKVLNIKSKALIKASIHSHVPQPENQALHTAEMMIQLLLKQQ